MQNVIIIMYLFIFGAKTFVFSVQKLQAKNMKSSSDTDSFLY